MVSLDIGAGARWPVVYPRPPHCQRAGPAGLQRGACAVTIPQDQQAVAQFLRQLAGAPPVETHISAVFVGPETVWKLKRAVRLPFLDFTTLPARRHFLQREYALNHPAAPEIYRDVAAVVRNGDGTLALTTEPGAQPPLDWVLRMAPVPQADFFDAIAARGGLSGKLYAWGDEFTPHGQSMANTFQGHFPDKDTGEDGYAGIAPVAQFAPNGYGLYDIAGNVWEWTSDWYRPDYYAQLASAGGVARNPHGPDSPFDPSEPTEKKRVHRGGSFLCTNQYCSRYMVGTRGKGEGSTGTNHVGFRLVKTS